MLLTWREASFLKGQYACYCTLHVSSTIYFYLKVSFHCVIQPKKQIKASSLFLKWKKKRLSALHFIRIHMRKPSKKQEKRGNYLHSPRLSKTDRLKYLLNVSLSYQQLEPLRNVYKAAEQFQAHLTLKLGQLAHSYSLKSLPRRTTWKNLGSLSPNFAPSS